jgi:molybdate transport system substrate-binding protein
MARAGAVLLAAAMLGACSAPGPAPREVTVYAAASLVTALDGIAATYEAAHGGRVNLNYAASATLAQQILTGADADIYISASLEWADEVAGSRPVLERRDALGNGLVLVVPASNPAQLSAPQDLAAGRVERVAMGDPESVPAGTYARDALIALDLWDSVQPKAVYTMDVRQALLYAERAEVDAAIVYSTDSEASTDVRAIATLDDALTQPVRYAFVLLDRTPRRSGAAEFFDYLMSDEAMSKFEAAGFKRISQSASVVE